LNFGVRTTTQWNLCLKCFTVIS